jgi:hypothetical protein
MRIITERRRSSPFAVTQFYLTLSLCLTKHRFVSASMVGTVTEWLGFAFAAATPKVDFVNLEVDRRRFVPKGQRFSKTFR